MACCQYRLLRCGLQEFLELSRDGIANNNINLPFDHNTTTQMREASETRLVQVSARTTSTCAVFELAQCSRTWIRIRLQGISRDPAGTFQTQTQNAERTIVTRQVLNSDFHILLLFYGSPSCSRLGCRSVSHVEVVASSAHMNVWLSRAPGLCATRSPSPMSCDYLGAASSPGAVGLVGEGLVLLAALPGHLRGLHAGLLHQGGRRTAHARLGVVCARLWLRRNTSRKLGLNMRRTPRSRCADPRTMTSAEIGTAKLPEACRPLARHAP